MRTDKPRYVPPTIEVIFVEIEEGVAATSQANISITGQNDFQPDVTDWRQESDTEQDYL